jgi:hypothetical protein
MRFRGERQAVADTWYATNAEAHATACSFPSTVFSRVSTTAQSGQSSNGMGFVQ